MQNFREVLLFLFDQSLVENRTNGGGHARVFSYCGPSPWAGQELRLLVLLFETSDTPFRLPKDAQSSVNSDGRLKLGDMLLSSYCYWVLILV